ncbi:MAG: hypothetical protein E7437_01280 [Ruminococcaceae bacterium]|nr:hypothetical protein [Oscillospiraceae bacterium]
MSYIRDALERSKDYFEDRYDRELEKNRKGDFTVSLYKDGKPYPCQVAYQMQQIDYDFGCNLFMLDQYDDPEKEQRYLENWRGLFNTAVVPLYWEGTEPTQGQLRYDADSANDVYRRPPVDRVVNYCLEHGIKMKGHPLFWHEFIPKWLPEDWDTLLPLIEKRFQEISQRYSQTIQVFDCVNEPSRIWDMCHEHATDGYKMVVPPAGYIEQIFALGKKYFPNNRLILNEATGVALNEFRGDYGAYYQLLRNLLDKGLKIDYIGLQCHVKDDPVFKNAFDAARLYGVLDGYARLGKPLVISEIGLSCEEEQLQAEAAERLYKTCFSHGATCGIFWWNLDDNGIFTSKARQAGAENLPYGGLCRDGRHKAAYQVLEELFHHCWTTRGTAAAREGSFSFRGFYGTYQLTVNGKTYTADLRKGSDKNIIIEV